MILRMGMESVPHKNNPYKRLSRELYLYGKITRDPFVYHHIVRQPYVRQLTLPEGQEINGCAKWTMYYGGGVEYDTEYHHVAGILADADHSSFLYITELFYAHPFKGLENVEITNVTNYRNGLTRLSARTKDGGDDCFLDFIRFVNI